MTAADDCCLSRAQVLGYKYRVPGTLAVPPIALLYSVAFSHIALPANDVREQSHRYVLQRGRVPSADTLAAPPHSGIKALTLLQPAHFSSSNNHPTHSPTLYTTTPAHTPQTQPWLSSASTRSSLTSAGTCRPPAPPPCPPVCSHDCPQCGATEPLYTPAAALRCCDPDAELTVNIAILPRHAVLGPSGTTWYVAFVILRLRRGHRSRRRTPPRSGEHRLTRLQFHWQATIMGPVCAPGISRARCLRGPPHPFTSLR